MSNGIKTITPDWDDPPPGSDPAWDSLTYDEKVIFRNMKNNNYGRDSIGKTFSDLLKDREALEMQAALGKITIDQIKK